MKVGIYPGSFDPMTVGHLDIVERAAKLVDKLVIAVLINPNKRQGLLDHKSRQIALESATKHLDNVEVMCFTGLLTECAAAVGATVVIRGIRSGKDLDMELGMAQINKQLGDGLETIFLMTAPEYACISSSVVRELIAFGGNFKPYVPESVYEQIKKQ